MWNYSKFKEQYREKYVAVYNEKIIDGDADSEKLSERLGKMSIDMDDVFIMYVPNDIGYLVRITKLT
jgi:hypothetical protein